MNNKRYILKKDLPGIKPGMIFISGSGKWYYPLEKTLQENKNQYCFSKEVVENTPEWFEQLAPEIFCQNCHEDITEELIKHADLIRKLVADNE